MTKHIPQMAPSYGTEEIRAVTAYLKSDGWLTEFEKTSQLEQQISGFTGSKHCVMTNNGTVTLILALLALGIKSGDEVLVPNLTMIATPNACVLLGIKPVLVDVDQDTLCLDLLKAQKQLTSKTKAMMYVSFNGRSGDMVEVVHFCRKHRLTLIEDAAQSLGSLYRGKHLGTFGAVGSLSFSVPKIITTGQGGALLTDSDALYQRLKKLKDFGRVRGGIDIHDDWGWNFKFTDLQAVIGLEQMKKLKRRIVRKKEMYKRYHDALGAIRRIEWIQTDLSSTSPWFIDMYTDAPDNLAAYLAKQGIGSRRIYPAISSQKIYSPGLVQSAYPVSRRYASRGLWLPSSAALTDREIGIITRAISDYYKHL